MNSQQQREHNSRIRAVWVRRRLGKRYSRSLHQRLKRRGVLLVEYPEATLLLLGFYPTNRPAKAHQRLLDLENNAPVLRSAGADKMH